MKCIECKHLTYDDIHFSEPIKMYVWCQCAEMDIPLKLCKNCKLHNGFDGSNVKCGYIPQ